VLEQEVPSGVMTGLATVTAAVVRDCEVAGAGQAVIG
jgi:hypothetical protein